MAMWPNSTYRLKPHWRYYFKVGWRKLAAHAVLLLSAKLLRLRHWLLYKRADHYAGPLAKREVSEDFFGDVDEIAECDFCHEEFQVRWLGNVLINEADEYTGVFAADRLDRFKAMIGQPTHPA